MNYRWVRVLLWAQGEPFTVDVSVRDEYFDADGNLIVNKLKNRLECQMQVAGVIEVGSS